jgi:hypothetical protein
MYCIKTKLTLQDVEEQALSTPQYCLEAAIGLVTAIKEGRREGPAITSRPQEGRREGPVRSSKPQARTGE